MYTVYFLRKTIISIAMLVLAENGHVSTNDWSRGRVAIASVEDAMWPEMLLFLGPWWGGSWLGVGMVSGGENGGNAPGIWWWLGAFCEFFSWKVEHNLQNFQTYVLRGRSHVISGSSQTNNGGGVWYSGTGWRFTNKNTRGMWFVSRIVRIHGWWYCWWTKFQPIGMRNSWYIYIYWLDGKPLGAN